MDDQVQQTMDQIRATLELTDKLDQYNPDVKRLREHLFQAIAATRRLKLQQIH